MAKKANGIFDENYRSLTLEDLELLTNNEECRSIMPITWLSKQYWSFASIGNPYIFNKPYFRSKETRFSYQTLWAILRKERAQRHVFNYFIHQIIWITTAFSWALVHHGRHGANCKHFSLGSEELCNSEIGRKRAKKRPIAKDYWIQLHKFHAFF